jgi:hypothetical protein
MMHEDFGRRAEIRVPSERTFGLVLAALFALMGWLPVIERGALPIVALVRPSLPRPVNRVRRKDPLGLRGEPDRAIKRLFCRSPRLCRGEFWSV